MDLLRTLLDLFLHLDEHLRQMLQDYGAWTYAALAAIVFLETGLVVTPFLPGDSLLFAAGTFAGTGDLDLALLLVLLSVAAIVGDSLNYWIGNRFGAWLLRQHRVRLVRPEHIAKTHEFFERYGGKTIVIARFVPIVRTCAPFVAGMGAMSYGSFMLYNVTGGLAWVLICTLAGYFFGSLPVVRDNFTLVILGIIAASLLPGLIEILRARRAARRAAVVAAAAIAEAHRGPLPEGGVEPALETVGGAVRRDQAP